MTAAMAILALTLVGVAATDLSAQPAAPAVPPVGDVLSAFAKQVLVPDLYESQKHAELEAKPEFFVQTRFSRGFIDGATLEDATQNFELTRVETHWGGRVSDRVGAGFELQFHPALEGSPEEIVNDAFVEFYLTPALTLRAGQFVKPFGFDIIRSSEDREFPERGMFAGYFFPGQRDRGLMLIWDGGAGRPALKNTSIYVAILNGNRFFADRDGQLDAVVRARKVFPALGLAAGVSVQFGNQPLPPSDLPGDDSVAIVGADAQWALGRLGLRFEAVYGTMPSTLLSLETEFAPAFAPGLKTSGVAAGAIGSLTDKDQIYGRLDVLKGDPVTGEDARAIDAGYLRVIDEHARIGVNWQWKDRPTFNDDRINTRLQVTMGVVF